MLPYRLKTPLSIPLYYNIIPCLFQLSFVFFYRYISFPSLIPSFSFFTPSKRIPYLQTYFRCSLYTYICTYSYLHFVIYIQLLIPIYTYLSILMFSLYYLCYYMYLIKLIKRGEYRNSDKISRLKSISGTEDNYLEVATGGVL